MFKTYLLGFIFSVILTLVAFVLVAQGLLSGGVLILTIISLAIVQLWIQLIMFLHLGQEVGPRWRLASWISTLGIILIVVLGTLWIMSNLNYHMPTEAEIMQDEGIER